MDKFCKAGLSDREVFLSTVSGVRVPQTETLCDLGVASAVLSSLRGKTDGKRRAYIGELALTGRIQGIHMVDRRAREALRLGFDEVVVPAVAARSLPDSLRGDRRVRTVRVGAQLLANSIPDRGDADERERGGKKWTLDHRVITRGHWRQVPALIVFLFPCFRLVTSPTVSTPI